MADGALIPSSQGTGFQTSGQVSWTSVSGSIFSFSFEALNRFRQLHLDVGTVASARILFSNFLTIPPKQQRLVHNALKQLKSFGIVGQSIFVGFGLKDVLVELAQTESGIACLTLGAALTTNYDSFFAAEVLWQLWHQRGGPGDSCPSIHQWDELLRLTKGAFDHTKFPSLVEGLARLFPRNPALLDREQLSVMHTDPKDLALAITEIANLRTVESAHCTLSGGVDCAWLAAFAEHFLAIPISAMDSAGHLLYQTNPSPNLSHSSASFTIIDGSDSSMIARFDVVLPLGKPLIVYHPSANTSSRFLRTSSWQTIFHDAFGHQFETLSKLKTASGQSQLYRYLRIASESHQSRHWELLNSPSIMHPRIFATPFMNWVKGNLAELACLFPPGRTALGDVENEPETFKEALISCSCCSSKARGAERKEICEYLAKIVLMVCRLLCVCDVAGEIPLNPSGLRTLFSIPALGGEPGLDAYLLLFTGHYDANRKDTGYKDGAVSALSRYGICAFRAPLEDPSIDLELWPTVKIVRGYISMRGSQYHTCRDILKAQPAHARSQAESLNSGSQSTSPLRLNPQQCFVTRELREQGELGVAIQLERFQGSRREMVPIAPARILYELEERRRLVRREHDRCSLNEEEHKWPHGACCIPQKVSNTMPLSAIRTSLGVHTWHQVDILTAIHPLNNLILEDHDFETFTDDEVTVPEEFNAAFRRLKQLSPMFGEGVSDFNRNDLPQIYAAAFKFSPIDKWEMLDRICKASREPEGAKAVFTCMTCVDCIIQEIMSGEHGQRDIWWPHHSPDAKARYIFDAEGHEGWVCNRALHVPSQQYQNIHC